MPCWQEGVWADWHYHCVQSGRTTTRPNFTFLQGNKVFLHSLTGKALLENHSKGATQNPIKCVHWQVCPWETLCGAKLWRLHQLGFNEKKSLWRLYATMYLPLRVSGQLNFNFLQNMDQRSIFCIYYSNARSGAEEKTFQRGEWWGRVWRVRKIEKLVAWHKRLELFSDVCMWFCMSMYQCVKLLCSGKSFHFSADNGCFYNHSAASSVHIGPLINKGLSPGCLAGLQAEWFDQTELESQDWSAWPRIETSHVDLQDVRSAKLQACIKSAKPTHLTRELERTKRFKRPGTELEC